MMGKKSRKMPKSNSDSRFDDNEDTVFAHISNSHYQDLDEDKLDTDDSDKMKRELDGNNGDEDDYYNDEDDSDDDDDEAEEAEEAIGDAVAADDDDEIQRGEEMEELEKEYRELKNEEQDILRNLKQHKDEDLQKGQAVRNQRALWDKTLEFRFLLQKAFTSSNKLPQEPVRSLFCETGSEVLDAYSDLAASSKKTLDSILELQQALLENNPLITQNLEESFGNPNEDSDKEWLQVSEMQSRIASFRNKSIDKWQRKTQVTTGAVAIKEKLHAFNQSISQQVAAYIKDPSKMIKSMQQNRSAIVVFGDIPSSVDNDLQKETHANGDPELLDDSDFYQQLLKEFFETIDPSSSETAFYAMKRLQTKKRKIVDRRASKNRKLRYHVHEKIVNFMAPQPMDLPPMASKLFENLFDLRTKNPTSVAQ